MNWTEYGDSAIVEGLQICSCSVTMANEQWEFFSVQGLISCDMEHPSFNLISRDIICRTFAIVTSTTCFNDLGLNGLDSNTRPTASGSNALTNCGIGPALKEFEILRTYSNTYAQERIWVVKKRRLYANKEEIDCDLKLFQNISVLSLELREISGKEANKIILVRHLLYDIKSSVARYIFSNWTYTLLLW